MSCSAVLRRLGLSTFPLAAGAILRGFEIQRCAFLPKHSMRSALSRQPLERKSSICFFSVADFSSKPYKSDSNIHLLGISDEEIKCVDHDAAVEETPELFSLEVQVKRSANIISLKRSYHTKNTDVLVSRPSLIKRKVHEINSRIEDHDVEVDDERPSLASIPLTVNVNKQKGHSLEFCCSAHKDELVSDGPFYRENNESYEGPGFREEEVGRYHRKHKQKAGWQGEHFHLLKCRGQHLLTNPRVLDSIIQKAKVLPTDTVLEIGPGTGNLTIRLLEHARKVIAIEIDKRMVDTLQNRIGKLGLGDKLSVIRGDALKMELPPFDLCVSNIPYGISSSLIAKLFLMPHKSCFRSAILLLQKEFACRLLAKPGESDFNRLAVNVGLVASVNLLMNVSKKDFIPCPKVDSSLVQIHPKLNIPDINLYEWLGFTRTCFSKKNKTLYAIFKQKKKIIELYEKSQSGGNRCQISEFEDQATGYDVDENNDSDNGDVGGLNLELERQNSAEILWFKDKIVRILRDGGFGEKRSSKLSSEDFLCLLKLFNKESVFFH